MGIDNLKKVLALLIALANLGDDVGRDTSPSRWTKLLSLITIVKDVPSIDLKAALAEIKDLDPTERAELISELDAGLTLGDQKLESIVENGLSIISDLDGVIERSVALVASLKA